MGSSFLYGIIPALQKPLGAFLIEILLTSYVENPSAMRNAKWADTREMGYFVHVIRGL